MAILVLSQEEVEQLLDMEGCIEAMAEALASLARGEVHVPLRAVVRPPGEDTFIGLMPAHRGGGTPLYSLKTVCVVPDNPKRGLDAHQGTVTLFDGETGETTCGHERFGDHRDPNGRGVGRGDATARARGCTRARNSRRGRAGALASGGAPPRPRLRPGAHLQPDRGARRGARRRGRCGGGGHCRGGGTRRGRRRHRDELGGSRAQPRVAGTRRARERRRRPAADDARARRRDGGGLVVLRRPARVRRERGVRLSRRAGGGGDRPRPHQRRDRRGADRRRTRAGRAPRS